jgi:hypothetical protein
MPKKRRRRRYRFADRSTVGRSSLVPFREGESSTRRHARRLATNIQNEEAVRAWCKRHYVELTITNEGHHWLFQCLGTGKVIEWWPSSAKMVVDKQWRKGVHVHDWKQALSLLEKTLCTKTRTV